MTTVFAVDIGGSGLRAALVEADGVLLARHSVDRPIGAASGDLDPALWWADLNAAVAAMAADTPDAMAGVSGICICGMTRTKVFVGADGAAVRPAIGFGDTRAAASAREASRLPMMTWAPRALSCLAAARPMPRVAPVMRMIGVAISSG